MYGGPSSVKYINTAFCTDHWQNKAEILFFKNTNLENVEKLFSINTHAYIRIS